MVEHRGHRARLRESFEKGGLDDTRLLELLLCVPIRRGDVYPAAAGLMERFGSIAGVLSATPEELMEVKGVGEGAAGFISMSGQLISSVLRQRECVPDAGGAGALMAPLFKGAPEELLAAACLTEDRRVISVDVLARGDSRGVDIDLDAVTDYAKSHGAYWLLLAHNHPSAVAIPSAQDRRSTGILAARLESVGVKLLDHLIMGEDDFVSMRDDGVLE